MITVVLFVGTVFVLILGWKTSQLVRAPHDAPLRAVTLCLASAAASFGLALSPAAKVIRSVGGAGAPRLVQNVFAFCMVFWLMCFYLYSATDPQRGRIRARWEALPLGLAILGTTLATIAASGHDAGGDYGSVDMRVSAIAVFYLLADLYLVYALMMALRWTLRHARASHRPLSVGLWLIASALGGIAAASAIRAALTLVRWRGGTAAPAVTKISGHLIAVAILLFLVGVGYPAVHARLSVMRLRRHRRSMYRRMHPLWSLLHEAYPQDALHRNRISPRGLLRWPRGVDRHYYRRAIECRDGLVRISPYLRQEELPGSSRSEPSADLLADRLCAALQAQAEGREAPYVAVAVAIPQEQGLDADVRQLVMLSDALDRRTSPTAQQEQRRKHHGSRRD
ncbi:MAB_1171c family putative transporter [Streptomyces mirabilis]|uniref:MAB_1171c family putative transporter n=1 Tax=Streptomyces mirabilis TaxID=68239 RepID=UPI0033B5B334